METSMPYALPPFEPLIRIPRQLTTIERHLNRTLLLSISQNFEINIGLLYGCFPLWLDDNN